MSIVLACVLLLLVVSLRFHREGYRNYISLKQTQAINGFFLMLVFLRHFNQYVTLNNTIDSIFLIFNTAIGQLIVTTFMFYSGYGVVLSILSKKDTYINKMPKNRIVKTLILFDSAIILYVIVNLILKIKMTIPQIILSMIGWEGVGNSTWYIFAITCMYIFTYLSFKIIKMTKINNDLFALILNLVMIVIYMFCVRHFKPSQYYNTVFCYGLGMFYAYFKDKIGAFVKGKYRYIASLLIAIVMFALTVHFKDSNLLINQLYYLCFVILITVISMKIEIKSNILSWCGKNLLGLYILQRLPMIIFSNIGNCTSYPYVYFALCLLSTIILTVIYSQYIFKNIQKLFN